MEDNFQIELNRIREDFNLKFERTMANSAAERNSIRNNTIREINRMRGEKDEIPKKAAYQAIGMAVGGVDFCFGIGTGLMLRYGVPQNIPINVGFYAVPLLLFADGVSRWAGLATDNKDLLSYGIITPVVKGIRKLSSYLRRQ